MPEDVPSPQKARRVAVLGGGPAGLAAAHRLLQPSDIPMRVDLYEATGRCGGVINSESGGGYRYELGPNSMNLKHAAVADLILEKLNLSSRVVSRSKKAKRYYLMREGKLLALPTSPVKFFCSSLLSWRAKFAVLNEPFVKRNNKKEKRTGSETVDQFFERRFGREIVDYVIDPMLAGIYSATPAELSMKHAFARIWNIERKKGSVIGGMFFGGAKAAPDPQYKAYKGKQLRASLSYDEGLQVLTETLETRIKELNKESGRGGRVYKHGKVRMLDQDSRGTWRVNGRGRYDAVISTIPAHSLSSIASNNSMVENVFSRLKKIIKYKPVSIVVLGYDKSQIPHPLDGFGALLPSIEGRRVLGVNFSSSNYPYKLEDPNKVFLTVYLGGSRNPELPFRPASEVVKVAKEELEYVVGSKGEPFYSRVKTWTKGIPVYGPRYDQALCAMARLERRNQGLVLGGNYRDGIGLPDALFSGIQSAERVLDYLKALP